jgi:hypothetical protein
MLGKVALVQVLLKAFRFSPSLVPKGQRGEAYEAVKKECPLENRGGLDSAVLSLIL